MSSAAVVIGALRVNQLCNSGISDIDVVVALLPQFHGKQLWSCLDSHLSTTLFLGRLRAPKY